MNNQLPYPMQRIIQVANDLVRTGVNYGSTGEVIAAAFVLNRMDLLPEGYTVLEAWDRLDDWQGYVRRIVRDYRHLLSDAANDHGY